MLCDDCKREQEEEQRKEEQRKNDIQRMIELRDLTLHAMKELGEIAEVLIRNDRPFHWKNELADLCGLCIKPMLDMAGMDFETACQQGIDRKAKKMEMLKAQRMHLMQIEALAKAGDFFGKTELKK